MINLKRADIAERVREAETGKKTTASESFKRLKDEKDTRTSYNFNGVYCKSTNN